MLLAKKITATLAALVVFGLALLGLHAGAVGPELNNDKVAAEVLNLPTATRHGVETVVVLSDGTTRPLASTKAYKVGDQVTVWIDELGADTGDASEAPTTLGPIEHLLLAVFPAIVGVMAFLVLHGTVVSREQNRREAARLRAYEEHMNSPHRSPSWEDTPAWEESYTTS